MGHTHTATIGRGHKFTSTYVASMDLCWGCHPFGTMAPFTNILVPSVASMIWVSIKFSLGLDEVMLDLAQRKFVYTNIINSVTAIQEVTQFYLI